MSFKIGLAQCKHPSDADVVTLVDTYAQRAVSQGVNLLVFPESLMTPFEKELNRFLEDAQPTDGPYAQAIDSIASRYGIWICYTLNELNPGGKPFNTAILVDSDGRHQIEYRKVHLFDSSTTSESSRMAKGAVLPKPAYSPFGVIGLGICYDLRFPEIARHAALSGAQVMLYPAAWVAGEHKIEQWETLLKARAVENEMYVAGLSRCDEGYIGQSRIVSPNGAVIARGGSAEELVVADIDLGAVDSMRSAIPVFEHRRSDLY